MAENFGLAFYKAQEGAKQFLPLEGSVLISVAKKDRPAIRLTWSIWFISSFWLTRQTK